MNSNKITYSARINTQSYIENIIFIRPYVFSLLSNSTKLSPFYVIKKDNSITVEDVMNSAVETKNIYVLTDDAIRGLNYTYTTGFLYFFCDINLSNLYIKYSIEDDVVLYCLYDDSYYYSISFDDFMKCNSYKLQSDFRKLSLILKSLLYEQTEHIKISSIQEYKFDQIKRIINTKRKNINDCTI